MNSSLGPRVRTPAGEESLPHLQMGLFMQGKLGLFDLGLAWPGLGVAGDDYHMPPNWDRSIGDGVRASV